MASEKGKALQWGTDVTYEICSNTLGGLAQDECIPHVYSDHLENCSRGSTIANISYADSLSSLLLPESCMLGLQWDDLIDSGATNNFLLQACYDHLAERQKSLFLQELLVEEYGTLQVTLADNSIVYSKKRVHAPIKMGQGVPQQVVFDVVPRFPCSVVFGMPQLAEHNPAIDWETYLVTFKDGTSIWRVPTEMATRPKLQLVSAKQIVWEYAKAGQQGWLAVICDQHSVKTGVLATNLAKQQDNNSNDASHFKQGLIDLLSDYADVFEPPGSSHPRELKHQIILEDENSSCPGLVNIE